MTHKFASDKTCSKVSVTSTAIPGAEDSHLPVILRHNDRTGRMGAVTQELPHLKLNRPNLSLIIFKIVKINTK
jgi:hypothetical protein